MTNLLLLIAIILVLIRVGAMQHQVTKMSAFIQHFQLSFGLAIAMMVPVAYQVLAIAISMVIFFAMDCLQWSRSYTAWMHKAPVCKRCRPSYPVRSSWMRQHVAQDKQAQKNHLN